MRQAAAAEVVISWQSRPNLKCLTLNGSRGDLQSANMWRRLGDPGRLERLRGRDVVLDALLYNF